MMFDGLVSVNAKCMCAAAGRFHVKDFNCCQHAQVVVDEDAEMLAIQGDAPYASPFQWADNQGDGPAARIHVESPGRFVRWVEVSAS